MRVFVNGIGIEVARGATALQSVAQADRAEAEGVAAGKRMITDSRGLAVAPGSAAFAGAIFRTVRARQTADEASGESA